MDIDQKFINDLLYDISAGTTVTATLIPQALSYSSLAGLPPICGLYASILPPLAYYFIGSSPLLSVGPVSLLALMTNSLIEKYNIDSEANLGDALDYVAQLSFCCSLILCLLSITNCGTILSHIPYPIINGFTNAAAILIGANQIKFAVISFILS